MGTVKTTKRDKVPFGRKMAFGSGHFVLNILPGTLSVFLQVFISDNTKSKWGRRRPYIFGGAIFSGILFMLMWQLDENASQDFNFWYVMILQIIFLIGNTMFATPLVGLGYEMTSDYNERTRLMAFSNTMGQVAWMIVPWLYVIIPDTDLFANQAEGVRQMAIVIGLICIIFGVLPSFFCKGIDASNMENRQEITLKTLASNMKQLWLNILEVSKNKPFMKLCGATFLVFNGFQIVAAFSVYIIVFYMYNGSWEQAGTWPAWFNTMNAVTTAFLVIPIISWMANKWGKRKAFIVSTFISIIGYILKWWAFDPESPFLIFMPLPFMAFGLGGLFTLMMSMTADVCDLDELENGMPRKEGTFGAIYWWMVKLGQALAVILGGIVLDIVGFKEGEGVIQTAETMHNIRIADIIFPVATAALAIWVMWKYNLTEERAKEIKAELVERRGEL